MLNSKDIDKIKSIFGDYIVEPITSSKGWVVDYFGVLFLNARIDLAFDPQNFADKPEPCDFGLYAMNNIETVVWNGNIVKVLPLELQLQVNKRRERYERVKAIEDYLKQNMFLPKQEISINKIVNIRGIDVQLISITEEEHRNVLWIMYNLPESDLGGLEEKTKYDTNRDKKINGVREEMSSHADAYISEIIIQNQKMTFSACSSNSIYNKYDTNYESYMRVQHFIEKGMITANWDEVDLKNIIIAAYEQEKSEKFPKIDLSKELDITIKVRDTFKEILINKPISIGVGEIEKGKEFYFYDSVEKKNRIFYIDEISHYDIWGDVNNRFENEVMKDLPEDQVKYMKEQHMNDLESVCPRGMNLLMIEYESEDDIQLNFYSKEYLDEKLVINNSSSAFTMFFGPDKKVGINGLRNRLDMIKPVEKDFNDIIDIELFSWIMRVPEEIIEVL